MAAALEIMDRPWEWGKADCCTAACDVFLRLHGIDPAHGFRGTYRTRRQARAIIDGYGGFLRMAEHMAFRASLQDGGGHSGEIGVVRVDGDEYGLGICIGGTWAAKSLCGMVTIREAVRFWRAP